MSRFMTVAHRDLQAYVPGEQPQDKKYIKLNTNESPFPPSPGVAEAVKQASSAVQLYSDPECRELRGLMSELYGVEPDQILMTNGSDEILNFAFMAFCGPDRGAAFPDITYGFYSVFAELHHIDYAEIPLQEDFSVNYQDYLNSDRTVFIANPNAPTGLRMPSWQVEEILKSNPDRVVVIDEAYGDFAKESCLPLVKKYDNLLITRTFSKSYSMAGARLGLGIGSQALIRDLNTIKYSTNPYNVNRLTAAAGAAALRENDYYMENCRTICKNREDTANALKKLGFTVIPSEANFLFAKHPAVSGEALYRGLKDRGVLVRHFAKPRTADYIRVTVGTQAQMDSFLGSITEILQGK